MGLFKNPLVLDRAGVEGVSDQIFSIIHEARERGKTTRSSLHLRERDVSRELSEAYRRAQRDESVFIGTMASGTTASTSTPTTPTTAAAAAIRGYVPRRPQVDAAAVTREYERVRYEGG